MSVEETVAGCYETTVCEGSTIYVVLIGINTNKQTKCKAKLTQTNKGYHPGNVSESTDVDQKKTGRWTIGPLSLDPGSSAEDATMFFDD